LTKNVQRLREFPPLVVDGTGVGRPDMPPQKDSRAFLCTNQALNGWGCNPVSYHYQRFGSA
jgi:hypothetical protein